MSRDHGFRPRAACEKNLPPPLGFAHLPLGDAEHVGGTSPSRYQSVILRAVSPASACSLSPLHVALPASAPLPMSTESLLPQPACAPPRPRPATVRRQHACPRAGRCRQRLAARLLCEAAAEPPPASLSSPPAGAPEFRRRYRVRRAAAGGRQPSFTPPVQATRVAAPGRRPLSLARLN
jgi:hypothetical protein